MRMIHDSRQRNDTRYLGLEALDAVRGLLDSGKRLAGRQEAQLVVERVQLRDEVRVNVRRVDAAAE